VLERRMGGRRRRETAGDGRTTEGQRNGEGSPESFAPAAWSSGREDGGAGEVRRAEPRSVRYSTRAAAVWDADGGLPEPPRRRSGVERDLRDRNRLD
jgi:hypothetical protein